jgi:hypothetical protein
MALLQSKQGRLFEVRFSMDHDEAVRQMAVERYLLNELTPEVRDSFEEHAFDCAECSLDLKSAAAFVSAAKVELPKLISSSRAESRPVAAKKASSMFWMRPAFAIPAFAALLVLVCYQNLSTIPSLKNAASLPKVLPSVAFHAGTRGNGHIPIDTDRTQGIVLSIQLPPDSGYASYAFTLYDPEGKQLWSRNQTAAKGISSDGVVSLVIPGGGLVRGSCTLATAGIDVHGARTEIDRHVLDVHFND